MDIDSYIANFKQLYSFIDSPCPDLERDIDPKKEAAFSRALSKELCSDMVNEIIKMARPQSCRIFRPEKVDILKTMEKAYIEKKPSVCVVPVQKELPRTGDAILGVYSNEEPKVYFLHRNRPENQIRLLKTDTITEDGIFYAFPSPIFDENRVYTNVFCENVTCALYMYENHRNKAVGFFPELCESPGHTFYLGWDMVLVYPIDHGGSCDRKLQKT